MTYCAMIQYALTRMTPATGLAIRRVAQDTIHRQLTTYAKETSVRTRYWRTIWEIVKLPTQAGVSFGCSTNRRKYVENG